MTHLVDNYTMSPSRPANQQPCKTVTAIASQADDAFMDLMLNLTADVPEGMVGV